GSGVGGRPGKGEIRGGVGVETGSGAVNRPPSLHSLTRMSDERSEQATPEKTSLEKASPENTPLEKTPLEKAPEGQAGQTEAAAAALSMRA
ncbi:hypothetical protein VR44_37360, partial [Streptomyces katrae]